MDNLIFSLNVTIPIFMMMILGMFFRKIGLFNKNFITIMNKFVFTVCIPAIMFVDLATSNLAQVCDGAMVLYCFVATILSVSIALILSYFFRQNVSPGEFVQASYRSGAAVMGLAFLHNVYGDYSAATSMIIGSVPLYNIVAVVVLTVFKPQLGPGKSNTNSKKLITSTVKGIITNPIILGIEAGAVWSLLNLPLPTMIDNTLHMVGSLTTPLGLMAMGAAFKFQTFQTKFTPIMLASFCKTIGFTLLFLPLANYLGFHHGSLVALLVMLGSPTTSSAYVMARNMGHEGQFTAATVMVTTLVSAFTLTFGLYVLKLYNLV